MASGNKRQSWQRDHCIASPVAEPGVARNNRLSALLLVSFLFLQWSHYRKTACSHDELMDPRRRTAQFRCLRDGGCQLRSNTSAATQQQARAMWRRTIGECRDQAAPFNAQLQTQMCG